MGDWKLVVLLHGKMHQRYVARRIDFNQRFVVFQLSTRKLFISIQLIGMLAKHGAVKKLIFLEFPVSQGDPGKDCSCSLQTTMRFVAPEIVQYSSIPVDISS